MWSHVQSFTFLNIQYIIWFNLEIIFQLLHHGKNNKSVFVYDLFVLNQYIVESHY